MTPQEEALHNILAPAYDLLGLTDAAVLTACGIPDADTLAQGPVEVMRAKLAEPAHAHRLIALFRAAAAQREHEAATFRRAAEAASDALVDSLFHDLAARERRASNIEWLALQHIPPNAKNN